MNKETFIRPIIKAIEVYMKPRDAIFGEQTKVQEHYLKVTTKKREGKE